LGSDVIKIRRSAELNSKEQIYKLIEDIYVGGDTFRTKGYLYKSSRESQESFDKRKDRTVYINHIAPIVEKLTGFIYAEEVKRKGIDSVSFLLEKCSRGKSFEQFIMYVARRMFLYTGAILVDTPQFDPALYPTEQHRKAAGLNPYCVFYPPYEIRDFYIDDHGVLQWILLDDSKTEKSDPFKEAEKKKIYTLWTNHYFEKFDIAEKEVHSLGRIEHGLGEIPVRIINYQDEDADGVTDSYFEDVAKASQAIYNYMSYLDEMLANGTFKVLFFPGYDEANKKPVSEWSVVGTDPNISTLPEFKGSSLSDLTPFLQAIEFFETKILSKFGMDTDKDKAYVQSGIAKGIDFEKVKTLLLKGVVELEGIEKWVFATAGLWIKRKVKPVIKYNNKFDKEAVTTKLERLRELLLSSSKTVRQRAEAIIVQETFKDDVNGQEIDKMVNEITGDLPKQGEEE
jgi:hypothetical protein